MRYAHLLLLVPCLLEGSVMASFSVESFGPDRLLHLTQEQINARLQAFRDLSSIPTIVPLVGISP